MCDNINIFSEFRLVLEAIYTRPGRCRWIPDIAGEEPPRLSLWRGVAAESASERQWEGGGKQVSFATISVGEGLHVLGCPVYCSDYSLCLLPQYRVHFCIRKTPVDSYILNNTFE